MTTDDGADHELVQRLERYYDGVPRRYSTVEEVGPFTLFVATSGWPYYARPTLGGSAAIGAREVQAVRARQRELGLPQQLEWVDDVTPGLAQTVAALGIDVHHCPLMVLEGAPRGEAGRARVLAPSDAELLGWSRAAIDVAFGHAGTAVGAAGLGARDAARSKRSAELDAVTLQRMASGELCQVAVWAPGETDSGPVGGGSYAPLEGVAEIAGVGILPAFRRQGLAAQVTYVLAADALRHGVTTVFCSADSEAVARVYEAIGFRRIGTACIAAPDSP